jgi:YidC/Oxa1 family membrane protein insertase
MDDQNKNLILATALSFAVILVWFLLFPPEDPNVDTGAPASADLTAPATPAAEPAQPTQTAQSENTPEAPTVDAPRAQIDTPRLSGSISLLGGRIDDLALKDYRETLAPDSPNVTLLKPVGKPEAYYTIFGWAPGGELRDEDVPGPNTLWKIIEGKTLSPSTPLVLEWDNDKGIVFKRRISVDDNFLISVEQEATNNSGSTIRMAPYSEIIREGEPSNLEGFFVVHEGVIRQTGKEMNELKYKKLRSLDADPVWGAHSDVVEVEKNGWLGFTDHYWMTMLIPDENKPFTSVLQYNESRDTYKTIARSQAQDIAPGQSVSLSTRVFAGAKEWQTIRDYERESGIYRFIDSIDWGWYFFLTKPIFSVLHWLNGIIGNMGWAIIALTLLIKGIMFPLAYKSYVSMAKMKELQPEMEKLKERAGDDRQKMQKEMMELYKREKVNPASGCLPIVLQIPVFFSLYKVVFVTLELRQAPWIGWIRDLSAPDPSSVLNLFGLLPYAPPDPNSFLAVFSLGLLPILLGISMWLQQKLNPTPTDPTQAMIFAWMPWVFMFMLGRFASGLVLYWITNNTITFTQQYLIMRSHGHKPDVFGNIVRGFRRKKPDPE